MSRLPVRRLLVGVTGSIAALSAPAIVQILRLSVGVEVKVMASESALRFVTRRALAVSSGAEVATDDLFEADGPRVLHVELARWAQAILIVPTTANVLGKLASGIADDLVTTTLLAASCPVMLVPSMNEAMWAKPVVHRNVERLRGDGIAVMDPAMGVAAAGGPLSPGALPTVPAMLEWMTATLGAISVES